MSDTPDVMLDSEEAEHYRKALEQPVCDLPAAKLPVRLPQVYPPAAE